MLKLTNCGKEIATINCNHRITIDEAIELVGGRYVMPLNCTDEDVEINDKMYYYEDLEMVFL